MTNITEFKDRYVSLQVYFETLQYTVIEQLPAMTLVGLLSNIGGQLGLFLGASLITICEIGDFLASLCLKICRKKKQVAISTANQSIAMLSQMTNSVNAKDIDPLPESQEPQK